MVEDTPVVLVYQCRRCHELFLGKRVSVGTAKHIMASMCIQGSHNVAFSVHTCESDYGPAAVSLGELVSYQASEEGEEQ